MIDSKSRPRYGRIPGHTSHRTRIQRDLLLLAVIVACIAPTFASAQGPWPSRPIRILVGFAPGGFTDTATRIIAQKLGVALNQQVVAENRPGANGLIAGDLTAKAPPDGHTLFMTSPGLATNPLLYERLRHDPLKDFTAVALVAGIPNVLIVHPTVPARSARDLIGLARTSRASLTQASAGSGSPGHLSGELLQILAGVKFIHIPYKGSGPAMIDLISGRVDFSFPSISSSVPHVKEGRLRAIGVTTPKRSPLLPDVPAIGERDVPGYSVVGWYGIVGPAGIPRDIVGRLNAELDRILKSRDVIDRLLAEGAEPMGGSPEEFAAFLVEEQRKWTRVVKAGNIKVAD